MLIIYSITVFVYLVLFFISGKRNKHPFDNIASHLYKNIIKNKLLKKKNKPSVTGQVKRDIEMLHPGLDHSLYVDQYYIQKTSRLLLLIFVGNILAIALWMSAAGSGILEEEGYINRRNYGEGNIQANLRAKPADSNIFGTRDFQIIVEEQMYEEETVKRLAQEMEEKLSVIMLGNNPSEDEIREDLNLVTQIEGYPFHIVWESDNYALLYSDGSVINEEVPEAGELVTLTAIITYGDYREEYIFGIRIFPPVIPKEDLMIKKIEDALKAAEEEDRTKNQVRLPDQIENTRLEWKENQEDNSRRVFLLMIISALIIYFLQDKDLHEKVRSRNDQMIVDYPGIVNKLTLYMGAGMTIRGAFCKIAYGYQEKKRAGMKNNRYAYEEMLITCHELESGVGEAQAYVNFGKRCRIIQYIKLSSLLVQNLKKGSNRILAVFRQEAANAFEERKNRAKKLGEEAGTKLLFPMMLMFGVVMVLIIVPAYFSFSI